MFQLLGNKNDPENVKKLNQHRNFKQISDKFSNSSASNKIHVCFTTPSTDPKHARHSHSQNSYFAVNLQNTRCFHRK